MLFGQWSARKSLRDVVFSVNRQAHKLYHLGLSQLKRSTLADGEDLLISGFGTFLVRQKNAWRGRNPQTQEKLMLRARQVVVFKTSGVLREKDESVIEPYA
jgi:nucleoid DNA-binding protein